MLRLDHTAYARMIGHCYDGLPLEACGLLAGPKGQTGTQAAATVCYPTRNAARSSRIYEVHGLDYRDADDDAEQRGLEILAVFHSHTHTDPYPSPTDVASALFPQWHYVLVSLRDEAPMTRSFRIVDGKITEEPVVLIGR